MYFINCVHMNITNNCVTYNIIVYVMNVKNVMNAKPFINIQYIRDKL